ncbi:hydrogenase maturation protease [Bdellovibrionota bacterium FG-1]
MTPKTLIYGIGNLARQDDGLGIRLVEMLEAAGPPKGMSLESNYQLNAEDALLIAQYDVVIFVDAATGQDGEAAFGIKKVNPTSEITFSTHAMSFGSVLALCERMCPKTPTAYLLTMPGYEWGFGEELTPGAQTHLESAFRYLMSNPEPSVRSSQTAESCNCPGPSAKPSLI